MIFAPLLLAAGVVIAAVLPMPLVLPALSILMVLSGFALASGLHLFRHHMDRGPADAWTIAGALVFLGFAAGILADGEEALTALEHIRMQRVAAQ
jgi:hypothetical protein